LHLYPHFKPLQEIPGEHTFYAVRRYAVVLDPFSLISFKPPPSLYALYKATSFFLKSIIHSSTLYLKTLFLVGPSPGTLPFIFLKIFFVRAAQ